MKTLIFFLGLYCLFCNENWVSVTNALPPPWKFLPLVPQSSSAGPPPLAPPLGYPPYLAASGILYGIPPFVFVPSDLTLDTSSNETDYTDDLIALLLENKKKREEAKVVSKTVKTTPPAPVHQDTIAGIEVIRWKELLQKLLASTTTPSPTTTTTTTTVATTPKVTTTGSTTEEATTPSSLAEILKELMQTG